MVVLATMSTTLDEDDVEKISSDDEKLILEAERLFAEESLLAATELLRKVVDPKLLKPHHEQILSMGRLLEESRNEMLASPEESGWKKQSESHG